MPLPAQQFGSWYRAISGDIFKFCEALKFDPTFQQRELFDLVMRAEAGTGRRRIAVKSGQGPGKTAAAMIVALWRTFRHEDALTVITAPTMRQTRDVALVELRLRVQNADPALRQVINVTKSRVEMFGKADWGIKLVTASKEENAQGYHRPNMTVICEEASGIERGIITQFKGTLSNPNSLMLQIGNPNTRDCAFFDCFNTQRHLWETLTWDAEETAEKCPHILDPQRNFELADEFGRDSDVYRIRVLGQFPHVDPNCVMSSEDLEKCCGDMAFSLECAKMLRVDGTLPARQFGLDFARFGDDESVIFRRSGNSLVQWQHFAHTEPADVVDEAFRMQSDAGWKNEDAVYVADASGMGQGIMHRFHDGQKRVLEFHNGGSPLDYQYANRITEGWFSMAKLVRGRRCSLIKDNRLLQQLSSRRYFVNKKGKLILEPKEDYMKRGFDSPDRADAAVYAFYDEVEVAGHVSRVGAPVREIGTRIARA